MLPEKLHLEQISRFHSKFLNLSKQINEETDKDKKLVLCQEYYNLTKLWTKIDDFVEFTLKHELDCIDNKINAQP